MSLSSSQIKDLLSEYVGKNPYLLSVKTHLSSGGELSSTQQMMCKRLLTTVAIENNDTTLLPQKDMVSFKIDWDTYTIEKNGKTLSPFDFQRLGVNWLLNTPRGILADEMGCGKTLQAIIAAVEKKAKKVLIVCPNTLKLNWKKEIEMFSKDEIFVIKKNSFESAKWIIVNYDKIHNFEKEFAKEKFDLLIGDEAHYAKSGRKARRSASFTRIANKIPNVWLLTGTPISNRPIDFYQLLKICKHDLGRRKDLFGNRYCDPEVTQWGTSYKGASNLKELHFKTQDVILRRTKNQVLDLPPKTLIPLYQELTKAQQKRYLAAAEDRFQEIYDGMYDEDSEHYGKDLEKGVEFIEMAAYRMFAAIEKVKDGTIKETVGNIIDSDNKVVIFTNFTAVVDAVKEMYGDNCVTLDGRVKMDDRQDVIDLFQRKNGPQVIVCNYKVGSVGVTLTEATYAIMNDLPWDPATLKQAEDRIHRIGQTKKTTIYFPIYEDTIDLAMFSVLREKIKYIDEIIDGKKNLTKFKKGRSVQQEVMSLIKKV